MPEIAFYFSNLLFAFLLVCTFVFIIASTTKVINEQLPINVVRQTGIKPMIFQFQDNHEMHYATEATSTSNISVATNLLLLIFYYILYTYLL